MRFWRGKDSNLKFKLQIFVSCSKCENDVARLMLEASPNLLFSLLPSSPSLTVGRLPWTQGMPPKRKTKKSRGRPKGSLEKEQTRADSSLLHPIRRLTVIDLEEADQDLEPGDKPCDPSVIANLKPCCGKPGSKGRQAACKRIQTLQDIREKDESGHLCANLLSVLSRFRGMPLIRRLQVNLRPSRGQDWTRQL